MSEQLQAVYQEYFTNETNGVLSDICEYSKARIEVEELTLESYYSTENMLPNKMGATLAASLPSTGKTPKCRKGDVLISNIRPYFKKIVYCYEDAGCSSDVLCFTAKSCDLSQYLYATLYMDKFFDYMVAGSKGTKMPRGDKKQIMNYPVYIPSNEELRNFSGFAIDILEAINKNKTECQRLEEIGDTLLPRLMSGEIDLSDIEV